MGQFPTNDGVVGRAMPLTAVMVNTIDARPAWLFQNSGKPGTNLDSSVIYCGTMPADAFIEVILPGTVGPSVVSGFVSPGYVGSGGTGYEDARFNIATTKQGAGGSGAGLTVNFTAVDGVVQTVTVNTPGTGYLNGDLIQIAQPGVPGSGAIFRVETSAGLPTATQAVKFAGLQSGSILPVAVDYVVAIGGTTVVADFVVCK
tara:strand:- start:47 stop:652 length:606 start_codon:yes stop_codon:yes gene_type:complete